MTETVHRSNRIYAVFGKYIGKCECGWQTNAVPERDFARKWLMEHIDYMQSNGKDKPEVEASR